MATILRDLSYRYQWLYDGISRAAALTVGGEAKFRQLAIANLEITTETVALDLCCGSGQATAFLTARSQHVTGLDASPLSIARAQRNVPAAAYVEGFAQDLPFADASFDLVHTSAALHEMDRPTLQKIIWEVYRVLKPGGVFTLVDFHPPTNPLFWPGLAMFMWLFETETAWALLETDLPGLLSAVGFQSCDRRLFAGGSLQVIHAYR
jgi:ubiquinone/menaquinone biosynthesis C-methylase UbiE